MREIIKCELGYVHEGKITCDTCGSNLLFDYHGVPITVDFSYGHSLDGNKYEFCSLNCLKRFVDAEIAKEDSK